MKPDDALVNQELNKEIIPTQDNLNYSLAIIEELVENTQKALSFIEDNKALLDLEVYTVLSTLLSNVKELVSIIDSNSTPVELIMSDNLSPKHHVSIIDKLGIGGEVIRLRQQGLSVNKIAAQMGINHATLMRFYKYYDKLKPSHKSKYQKSSVFDTTSRLEELKNIIVRRMYALEGVNDEVARQYTAELRQTYALAIQITEKIASFEQYKMFTKTVFELIKDELPHKRNEILTKIQAIEKGHLFDV